MNQLAALLMNFVAPGVWMVSGITETDQAIARAQERSIVPVSFAGVLDKAGVMTALQRDLSLPEHFGKNWDALADCLTDLEPASVFTIEDAHALVEADPKSVEILNDVLSESGLSFLWVGAEVGVPEIPDFWAA